MKSQIPILAILAMSFTIALSQEVAEDVTKYAIDLASIDEQIVVVDKNFKTLWLYEDSMKSTSEKCTETVEEIARDVKFVKDLLRCQGKTVRAIKILVLVEAEANRSTNKCSFLEVAGRVFFKKTWPYMKTMIAKNEMTEEDLKSATDKGFALMVADCPLALAEEIDNRRLFVEVYSTFYETSEEIAEISISTKKALSEWYGKEMTVWEVLKSDGKVHRNNKLETIAMFPSYGAACHRHLQEERNIKRLAQEEDDRNRMFAEEDAKRKIREAEDAKEKLFDCGGGFVSSRPTYKENLGMISVTGVMLNLSGKTVSMAKFEVRAYSAEGQFLDMESFTIKDFDLLQSRTYSTTMYTKTAETVKITYIDNDIH